jgi:sulfide:quinone oxidoreductase
VLVAGAGVAGLEFSLRLAELAPDRADVQLLSPEEAFAYRPFAVAETFRIGPSFRLALTRIAGDAGATWHAGELVSVDQRAHVAYTARGEALPYDLLVIAAGARPHVTLLGALTFRGEHDEPAFRALLGELESGSVGSVAFVVPPGPGWPLPLYELALMTAAELGRRSRRRARLVLVTPESAPLERFETAVSSAVAALLDDAGIEVHCGSYAAELSEDGLRLVPEQQLDVERVVALPRLRGPYIAGLRCNHDGFLRADRHGLVLGVDDVYAIGDATSFPLKHGGIAVQQAGAAAESVAARLGLSLRPAPFRPVLRGLLLSGETPRFVWADSDGADETSTVAYQPLWWPPSKITGGRLAGYLGSRGLPVPEPPTEPSRLPVELTLAPCETAAKLEPAGV